MHRSEPITLLTAVMQSYYCICLFVCFLKSINPFFKLPSFYLAAVENLFKNYIEKLFIQFCAKGELKILVLSVHAARMTNYRSDTGIVNYF